MENNFLIDTHCHLDMSQFDQDRPEVIERAKEAEVKYILTVGSGLESSRAAVSLARSHENIYAAVGVHPHDAKDFDDDAYKTLLALANEKKTVAIGETGLDYHYMHSPKDVQIEVFKKHIELARETGLPLIIHSREAEIDTLRVLAEAAGREEIRGVLHCFSGDMEMAKELIRMGFYISFAGPVTFKSKKSAALAEVAASVPDDHILVETDAPYLAPEPFRGKRNEPAYVRHTAEHIAQLRGITLSDLARITSVNGLRLFGIGEVPGEGVIAYPIRDSLYLNVTNRCTNNCCFCVRMKGDFVKGHMLKLVNEPSAMDLEGAIGDPKKYSEIVFCGYGEPLMRFGVVKEVAKWVKENGGRVRINTNGQGNLVNGRDILPELAGLVDSFSISLDAQDEETYERLCKPFHKQAFKALLDFISESVKYVPDVQVTVVETDGVDVEACRSLARRLGVEKTLRVRKLDVVG
ncbi:MAG: YchF/TatD family DNA exonuclease [Nitrospiraceae bacterium]|nr:YchF/TatD family DNA exonuclease [Nitrospiraceae bacterium]